MSTEKHTRETDRFVVVTEDGEDFVVIQYTDFISVQAMRQPRNEYAGHSWFQTLNDDGVDRISDDTYLLIFPEPLGNKTARRLH